MTSSETYLQKFEKLLSSGDVSKASELIENQTNGSCYESTSSTLSCLMRCVSKCTKDGDPFIFNDYSKVLEVICARSSPDDVLLSLIKESEEVHNRTVMLFVLKPLCNAMVALLSSSRDTYLAWFCNCLLDFVNNFELPKVYNLSDEEILLADCDENIFHITSFYEELLPSLEPITQDITKKYPAFKVTYVRFWVQLLEKLSSSDLSCRRNTKSKSRIVADKIVHEIIKLYRDVFNLFDESNRCCDEDITVAPASIGILYFLILCEGVDLERVPKVYDRVYLFQNCLQYSTALLERQHQFVNEAGLKLADELLKMNSERYFTYKLLDSVVHVTFCDKLSNVMICSTLEEHRQLALKVFKSYLYNFDTRGRYLIIYNITLMTSFDSLASYVVTQYKEMLVENLKIERTNSEFFTGSKLTSMLKLFCKLPDGVETDLVESANRIVAVLNLLRFLILFDKKNCTGIWNDVDEIRSSYLEPLQKGLDLSKAHYQLELDSCNRDAANGNKKRKSEANSNVIEGNVSVTVDEQNLPHLSSAEKIKTLKSALTAFDMIECLLCRVNECLKMGCEVSKQ